MNGLQKAYLKRELFNLAWRASTQHAGVYQGGVSDAHKRNFKNEVKAYITELIENGYVRNVSREEHERNISQISLRFSAEQYHPILRNGVYRIGVAQKLFNLYLKYLWCIGLIPEPPECPVDRVVLYAIGIHDINWTEMTSLDDYMVIVDQIEEIAYPKSIAQWELEKWNEEMV